jgi:hypothetical protein
MGRRFNKPILFGNPADMPASRVQMLWARVIIQATTDALAPRSCVRPEGAEQNLDWLASEDCAVIIEYAGYDADAMMPRLAYLVAMHRAGTPVIKQRGQGYVVGDGERIFSTRRREVSRRKRRAA